jgi:hypothetical protein
MLMIAGATENLFRGIIENILNMPVDRNLIVAGTHRRSYRKDSQARAKQFFSSPWLFLFMKFVSDFLKIIAVQSTLEAFICRVNPLLLVVQLWGCHLTKSHTVLIYAARFARIKVNGFLGVHACP